jgi:hypothetical protein
MNEGVFPWWTDPGVRLAFFRPLSGITHWIDWHWLDGKTGWMHLHSFGWYAALLGALALTYRRFAPGATALLALLLYGIDDAHAPTVGWIANRSALLAVCFSVLAVGAHDAWRKNRSLGLAWLGPTLLGVGLLAGETGVAGAAYLLAYALFLERGSFRVRAATLLSDPVGTSARSVAVRAGTALGGLLGSVRTGNAVGRSGGLVLGARGGGRHGVRVAAAVAKERDGAVLGCRHRAVRPSGGGNLSP